MLFCVRPHPIACMRSMHAASRMHAREARRVTHLGRVQCLGTACTFTYAHITFTNSHRELSSI